MESAAGAPASGAVASDANVLKILVASDMHLGYGERDPIRGDDSYITFEECFALANAHQVDMVLLAGDLFHDNKPSRKALQRAISDDVFYTNWAINAKTDDERITKLGGDGLGLSPRQVAHVDIEPAAAAPRPLARGGADRPQPVRSDR